MSEAIIRQAAIETWEDHVEAWHHCRRQVDGSKWDMAAIAASVNRIYRDRGVEKFAVEVGSSPRSMWRLIQIQNTFPENCRRRQNLTFKHYEEAVTAPDPVAALDLAETEGLSANNLRKRLHPKLLEPATCGTETGACGPVTDKAKAFHVAALVDALKQSVAVFEAIKEYDIEALFSGGGTKKSLREISAQIDPIVEWLQSLKQTIQRRIK